MGKLFYSRAYLRYLVLIDPEKRRTLIKEMQKLVGGTENGHFGKMRAVRRFSVRSSYGYQQKDKDARAARLRKKEYYVRVASIRPNLQLKLT